jgi:hypothetical protein
MCRLLLAAMAVLVLLAAIQKPVPKMDHPVPKGVSDVTLYQQIEQRMMRGESYYTAAPAQQRAWGYPTAPAQVFREPTLAWVLEVLRYDPVRRVVIVLLSAAALFGLRDALERAQVPISLRILSLPLIGGAMAVAWGPLAAYFHEVWANILIALSLVFYRPPRWRLSVLIGLFACLIRELAVPYLLAMAAFALYERRYREVAGWAAAVLVFACFYAWHVHMASGLHRPGDYVSQGWLYLGGWPFVIEVSKRNLAWIYAPNFVIAAIVCLSLIGLAGYRNPWISRIGLIVGGYLASFLFVGRPDTSYWGIMITTLVPIGVGLSPLALRDLISRAWSPHPVPVALRDLQHRWLGLVETVRRRFGTELRSEAKP